MTVTQSVPELFLRAGGLRFRHVTRLNSEVIKFSRLTCLHLANAEADRFWTGIQVKQEELHELQVLNDCLS